MRERACYIPIVPSPGAPCCGLWLVAVFGLLRAPGVLGSPSDLLTSHAHLVRGREPFCTTRGLRLGTRASRFLWRRAVCRFTAIALLCNCAVVAEPIIVASPRHGGTPSGKWQVAGRQRHPASSVHAAAAPPLPPFSHTHPPFCLLSSLFSACRTYV